MTTTTDTPGSPDAPDTPESTPAKPSRMEAWRAHSFGPASEQPFRRRTSDWFRLVIGIGILVFAIWHEDSPDAIREEPLHHAQRTPEPARLAVPSDLRTRRAVGTRPRRGGGARDAALAPGARSRHRRRGHLGAGPHHRLAGRRELEPPALPRHRGPRRPTTRPASPRCAWRSSSPSSRSRRPTSPVRCGASGSCSCSSWRSPRSTWVPRSPTARSLRSRSGGASPRSCTSCSAHPADVRRPRRCTPRCSSSGSTPTTSTCSRSSRAPAR